MRRAKPLLGTYVEIGVKTSTSEEQQKFARAIQRAFSQIEIIQRLLSFHDSQSELSQLNANPNRWLNLNEHSMAVLRLAKRIGILSQNKFNCTLGGALVTQKVLPQLVSHAFLSGGSASDIEFRGSRVRIRKPLLISLDGIAKGYAVDLAVKQLLSDQITAGWVNAGGDLRVFGDFPLSLCQRQNNRLSAAKPFRNIALASSRVAQHCTAEYSALILDGVNECPLSVAANDEEQVITIAADEAWRADALTKVAANLTEADRAEWIERLGGRYVQFGN